jgi:hypothetical protein
VGSRVGEGVVWRVGDAVGWMLGVSGAGEALTGAWRTVNAIDASTTELAASRAREDVVATAPIVWGPAATAGTRAHPRSFPFRSALSLGMLALEPSNRICTAAFGTKL